MNKKATIILEEKKNKIHTACVYVFKNAGMFTGKNLIKIKKFTVSDCYGSEISSLNNQNFLIEIER